MSQNQIYIFCIINTTCEINIRLGKYHIYSIPWRDISAVVTSFEKTAHMNTHIKKYALTHERVVELILNTNYTVLPMRLLTIVNNEENVLGILKEYYGVFKDNFNRLSQKVEFGLKIIWPAEKIKEKISSSLIQSKENEIAPTDSPAMMSMKKKFKIYEIEKIIREEAEKYIKKIDEPLLEFIVEKKLQKLQTEKLLLNASYLVEKSRQNDIKQVFVKIKKDQPDLKYQFSGPWAPYNFIVMEKEKSSRQESLMSNMLDNIIKH